MPLFTDEILPHAKSPSIKRGDFIEGGVPYMSYSAELIAKPCQHGRAGDADR